LEAFSNDHFISDQARGTQARKQIARLQKQLGGLRAAAEALRYSAMDGAGRAQKRVLSAEGRAKISKAAKRRWGEGESGGEEAVS